MKEKMHIYYDAEGDYLEIRFGEPTASHYEKVAQDTFVRIEDKTGKVTGYAIYNVQKKKEQAREIDIEFPFDLISNKVPA